jgi:hypothetical protein
LGISVIIGGPGNLRSWKLEVGSGKLEVGNQYINEKDKK